MLLRQTKISELAARSLKHHPKVYLNMKIAVPKSNFKQSPSLQMVHQARGFSSSIQAFSISDTNKIPETQRFVLWTNGDDCPQTGASSQLAKLLLEANGKEYEEICVACETDQDMEQWQSLIGFATDPVQLPCILISGEHIGGIQDLKAYLYRKNHFNLHNSPLANNKEQFVYSINDEFSDMSDDEELGE